MAEWHLRPGHLTLSELRHLLAGHVRLSIELSYWPAVEASAQTIAAAVARGAPAYGINTGFGKLAKVHIADDQLERLQLNLVRSHAVGVGAPLDEATVRLVLALKAASLGRGASGVRRIVIESLLALYNANVLPRIPAKDARATCSRMRAPPQ
jgi:histidine ammonia-lyase